MQRPTDTGSVHVSGRWVAATLLGLISGLILIQCGLLVLVHIFDRPYVFGLVNAFDFGGEGNITALVSTLLMIACACMLAFTGAMTGKGDGRLAWFLLAGVFLFLGVDEATMIHEFASAPTRAVLHASWVPQLAWVLPYGAAMIGLAVVLLPWFLKLDRPSQIRFFAAGALFVAGAIGFELIESVQMRAILAEDPDTVMAELQHPVIDTVILFEESLELIGLGIFLHALVGRIGGLTLRPGHQGAATIHARRAWLIPRTRAFPVRAASPYHGQQQPH